MQRSRSLLRCFLLLILLYVFTALADSAVVLRVVVDVTEENFFTGRRTLTRELKILFDDNNIEIPFTQIVLHQADK